MLVNERRSAFEFFLDPAPAGRISDVHEFRANRAAVDAASFFGVFTIELEIRMRNGLQKSEWIEVGFEVSPMAEGVEYALPLTISVFR